MIERILIGKLPQAAAVALGVGMLAWSTGPAVAAGDAIEVISSEVTSEFPDGFRIKLKAAGPDNIVSASVRLTVGESDRTTFTNFQVLPLAPEVDAELFWRTNTVRRYIPPGTPITYQFELKGAKGDSMESEPQTFVYHDTRFEWHQVSGGPVTLNYHGPVKHRAEAVLETILDTMDRMGPLLGSDIMQPITVTMYNNVREMFPALPPRSQVQSRGLITEGQAFSEFGTLLVLGGGRSATGVASHEVTHILVHRAGDGMFRSVPSWVHEGLAEYGNVAPGDGYDTSLEFAVGNDRVLPVMFMSGLPGTPQDVMIFYGQSKSIIDLMIDTWGAGKMKDFMVALKNNSVDNALIEVYGVDREALDSMWRTSMKTKQWESPPSKQVRPTPVPMKEVLPYSFSAQDGVELIADRKDEPAEPPLQLEEPAIAESGDTAATAPPEEPNVAEPEPPAQPEEPPAPDLASEPEPVPDPQPGATGACAAPGHGPKALDLSSVALMVGLVGVGFRRRLKL